MKTTILTVRNAHRAVTVHSITAPESGAITFRHNAHRIGPMHHASIVGEGPDEMIVYARDYKNWEIVEFRPGVTLEEFDNLAAHAWSWSSFDPERRGALAISEHEQQLNGDLEDMPEEEKERYIAGYKQRFSAWLSAQSRCASSAITGGSGFNVRRAEKANNVEHKRYGELIEWRGKALRAIAKRKEAAKPAEQVQDEAWKRLRSDIESSAATIITIDRGEAGYSRPLFVSSIFNKVATHAGHGNVEIVEQALAFIRELNAKAPKPIITERHKFFGLAAIAAENRKKKEEVATKESGQTTFPGCRVVENTAEDRLQIFFDEKPSAEIIAVLKRNAFKWAPSKGAWQRQFTSNAVWAFNRSILPLLNASQA